MDVSDESIPPGVVSLFPKSKRKEEVIAILKEALHAAETGNVATVGIAYVSTEGEIVKGSEGNAAYNTALMGGLMSLSISLDQAL